MLSIFIYLFIGFIFSLIIGEIDLVSVILWPIIAFITALIVTFSLLTLTFESYTPQSIFDKTCSICGKKLDQESDITSRDCGGDCLQCMADAGDPECIESLKD